MKSFSNFSLVYSEEVKDRSAALKREAALKKLTHTQKEKLIAGEEISLNI